MTYFYVGGELQDDCYLWLMQDSGIAITAVAGIPVTVIPEVVYFLAAAPTKAGGLFVGSETAVYKVNRTTQLLDTTWATAGVYAVPDTLTGVAVDSSGFVALACSGGGGTADVILLDASGIPVWSKVYAGVNDTGSTISFRADNGNIVYAKLFTGTTPQVLELNRVNGATVAAYGNDGTVWNDIYACKYIPGSSPFWYSRTKWDGDVNQIVSATSGIVNATDFPVLIHEFDVSVDKLTIIGVGSREDIPE